MADLEAHAVVEIECTDDVVYEISVFPDLAIVVSQIQDQLKNNEWLTLIDARSSRAVVVRVSMIRGVAIGSLGSGGETI